MHAPLDRPSDRGGCADRHHAFDRRERISLRCPSPAEEGRAPATAVHAEPSRAQRPGKAVRHDHDPDPDQLQRRYFNLTRRGD